LIIERDKTKYISFDDPDICTDLRKYISIYLRPNWKTNNTNYAVEKWLQRYFDPVFQNRGVAGRINLYAMTQKHAKTSTNPGKYYIVSFTPFLFLSLNFESNFSDTYAK
jgi:hypothetical protein